MLQNYIYILLHRSGEINNNVLKPWLLDLQAVHYRSAATLETVTK
jgi:hypothetical protein